jgi:hypothetical protein
LCDQGHKLNWQNRGLWIPLDVFGRLGDHSGMIPEGRLPERKRTGLSTTIKLSNAAECRARVAATCCVCDCPPFHNAPL